MHIKLEIKSIQSKEIRATSQTFVLTYLATSRNAKWLWMLNSHGVGNANDYIIIQYLENELLTNNNGL